MTEAEYKKRYIETGEGCQLCADGRERDHSVLWGTVYHPLGMGEIMRCDDEDREDFEPEERSRVDMRDLPDFGHDDD